MSDEVTITPEQAVEQANAAVVEAKKRTAKAEQDAKKIDTSDLDALLAAAQSVKEARSLESQAESKVKLAENAVKVAEWTRKAEILTPMQTVRLEVCKITDAERESMNALEVEGFTVTVFADPTKADSIVPFGPGIPKKSSAPKASTGGKSRGGKWTFNGQSGREFLEAHRGEQITEKVSVDAVLAEPARYGLTDYARRFAEKVGVTPTPIE